MIKQQTQKGPSKARRCWQVVFTLLLIGVMAFSSAPELTASALYFISDGINTVIAGGTERVDSDRIVATGVTVEDDDVRLEGGKKVVIRQEGSELYATSRTGESVSELLRREGVSLSPLEMVFVDLSGEDIVLEIATDFTYYETESEPAAYTTVYRTDYTLPKGTSVVTEPGETGTRDVTYEVIYADGALVSRQRVTEAEHNVKKEVVSVGTLVTEAQPGDTIASVKWNEDGSGYLILASGDSMHFTGSMNVTCTAYSSEQRTVGTVTYTGTTVEVGVVAVDKKVIPLGTRMFITTADGSYTYGMGRAEDTGVFGASVDLYMNTIYECRQFGRRGSVVYFLDKP